MLSSGLGISIIILSWYQIYSGINDGSDIDINDNLKDVDGTGHDGDGGDGKSGARRTKIMMIMMLMNDDADDVGSHDDGYGI